MPPRSFKLFNGLLANELGSCCFWRHTLHEIVICTDIWTRKYSSVDDVLTWWSNPPDLPIAGTVVAVKLIFSFVSPQNDLDFSLKSQTYAEMTLLWVGFLIPMARNCNKEMATSSVVASFRAIDRCKSGRASKLICKCVRADESDWRRKENIKFWSIAYHLFCHRSMWEMYRCYCVIEDPILVTKAAISKKWRHIRKLLFHRNLYSLSFRPWLVAT